MKTPAVLLSLSLALIFQAAPSLAASNAYEHCERLASKRIPGSDTDVLKARERFIKACVMAKSK